MALAEDIRILKKSQKALFCGNDSQKVPIIGFLDQPDGDEDTERTLKKKQDGTTSRSLYSGDQSCSKIPLKAKTFEENCSTSKNYVG